MSDSTAPTGEAWNQGIGPQPAGNEPGERPGDYIGPYLILSKLGKGGFGTVWLAERRDPLVQRVALKILNPGMDTREVLARFEQERQALAVMNHPNVAKVFDAGATPAGRPYFAMEYVPGEPITAYCDRHRLSIRQRLELFIPVCEAVQHAHHKGIIHRDIKPSNILVGVHEGRASPKVIDFGVAKAVSHTLTAMTIFTEHGHMIGSPEYMSPEQAEMGGTDVDTRTDVYALGVVLYELLSGLLPFDSKTLRAAGTEAICRIIRDREPPRPSTRLGDSALVASDDQPSASLGIRDVNALMDASAILKEKQEPRPSPEPERPPSSSDSVATRISEHRRTTLISLVRELRRELEWIPLKAIRKDRAERYDTPMDLAQDIQRYLKGEPLEAGPESAAYRLRKLVRRNKGLFAASGAVLLALVLGLGTTLWQYQRANDRAEAATRAEAQQELLRKQADAAKTNEQRERLAADSAIEWLETFAWQLVGSKGQPAEAALQFLDQLDKGLDERPIRQDLGRQASLRIIVSGLYQSLGAFPQSQAVLTRGIDQLTRAGAGESKDADRLRAYLAFAQVQLGDPTKAAQTLDGAIERSARRSDDDALRLLLLYTQGAVSKATGEWRRAEEALVDAMRLHEHLGRTSLVAPDNTMDLLATVIAHDPARQDQALKVAEDALEFRREQYGPQHPKVVVSLNTVAEFHRRRGELRASERSFREAMDIVRSSGGPPTLETSTSQHNMAALLRDLGEIKEGIALESEALQTRRRLLGNSSPFVADSLNLLGALYADDGAFDLAQDALREALQIRDGASSPEGGAIAGILTELANVLVKAGHPDEALPMAQRAVDLRTAIWPSGNWLLWNSKSVLGSAMAALRRFQDAKPLIDGAATAVLTETSLAARPRRVIVERAVAFYKGWGHPDDAAVWQAKLDGIVDKP